MLSVYNLAASCDSPDLAVWMLHSQQIEPLVDRDSFEPLPLG